MVLGAAQNVDTAQSSQPTSKCMLKTSTLFRQALIVQYVSFIALTESLCGITRIENTERKRKLKYFKFYLPHF